MVNRPNLIFIIFDDLNDLIVPLDGRRGAKTPNIERFMEQATIFDNAHCAAPVCNASRCATFLGRYPFETGLVGNRQPLREYCEDLTLFEALRVHGYRNFGIGKVFHDESGETWQSYQRTRSSPLPVRYGVRTSMWERFWHTEKAELPNGPPMQGLTSLSEWSDGANDTKWRPGKWLSRWFGSNTAKDELVLPYEEYPDYVSADRFARAGGTKGERLFRSEQFDWGDPGLQAERYPDAVNIERALEFLDEAPQVPYTLAVGMQQTHLPWYVPQEFVDRNRGTIEEFEKEPDHAVNALPAWSRKRVQRSERYRLMEEYRLSPEAIANYLGTISFADELLGRLFDKIESLEDRDNTLVVLTGDHGWHLGEHFVWGKSTLWERSTRVPLIMSGPGVPSARRCSAAVSLLDIYPTLLELCGAHVLEHLAGRSLRDRFEEGESGRPGEAVTSLRGVHNTLRTDRWRYIRYRNGGEELYDHNVDPQERENLAGHEELSKVKAQLKDRLAEIVKSRAPGSK